MNKFLPFLLATFFLGLSSVHAQETYPLDKALIDLSDLVSLQNGAKIFVNHCQACHSLKYVRYSDLAQGLGLKDGKAKILEKAIKDNLMFVGDKLSDSLLSAMPKDKSADWFGTPPPDLSLVARLRGPNWLYTYLRSFYKDDSKPWGVNNAVFPDVAMPHVLLSWQGVQEPVFKINSLLIDGKINQTKKIEKLVLTKEGQLTPAEYNKAVLDLVNFLAYVGEPHQEERKRLGVWVLIFLSVFLVFVTLLKKEYWKDIH
ncbi:MAG: cytochrome [Francisellaceae bacterium]|nr:cytochrome [Francisellaceae bacterium]